jgi:hypothetical protein
MLDANGRTEQAVGRESDCERSGFNPDRSRRSVGLQSGPIHTRDRNLVEIELPDFDGIDYDHDNDNDNDNDNENDCVRCSTLS